MANSPEPRVYPKRLHHAVPPWVEAGSYFHIRLRVARSSTCELTRPENANVILDAVRNYHDRGRWYALLFMVMPDHTHAILAFPPEARMSRVIGEWKHYVERTVWVAWQDNYFDHRIRDRAGLKQKYAYILRNPVVKGLCQSDDDWPWVWKLPVDE